MAKVAIFIPARLNSSRFPQKILAPINGIPMIIHVLNNARALGLGECYVACCSEGVKKIVEEHGGQAIVTDPNLPSGTDRVFAAVRTLSEKPDIIVNLQGDMPIFSHSLVKNIINVMVNNKNIDMATPVVMISDKNDINNKNKVKVVFENMEKNAPGRALYFSREAIPSGAMSFYSHIGVYAYKYNSLEKFVSLKPSYLEQTERLEQLRCLENNMNVWAVPVSGVAYSVDVPSDLDSVICCINGTNLFKSIK